MTHPRISQLLNEYHPSPWITICYFFYDRGTTIQKSIQGFIGEVLYQLLHHRKDLFQLIYPIYSQLKWLGLADITLIQKTWSISKIMEVLVFIGINTKKCLNICVFVDALDEHDEKDRTLLFTLNELQSLTINPYIRLRLCVAGYPEYIFRDAF